MTQIRITKQAYKRAKEYQKNLRQKGIEKRLADCYAELYNQEMNSQSVFSDVLSALRKAQDRNEDAARRGGRLF